MKFAYRPYQETAITETMLALKDHRKVGAVLPTGAGKTEVFVGVAAKFLAENPDKSVLNLSHLSLLTSQTKTRFASRAPGVRVGVLQAEIEPAPDSHVIISTMQSSKSEHKIDRFKDRMYRPVGLIIVDECHYLTTESYEKAIGYFPDAKIFGVTATPFRERQVMTSYFDKISFSISMQELINDGYLVPPVLKEIVKKSDDVDELISMVTRIYQEKEMGNKAIVFMRTIEDAKALRNAFENHGIKAHAVTSELTGEDRDEVLDGFRDNDTMVLTTVNVLTAGFDAPNVNAIFMPYHTTSPTMYMQRIGRGLRPFPGKSECRIYVMGDAPSIARKSHEAVHRHAMNGTAEWKEFDTFADDLKFNLTIENHPQYLWAQRIVDITARMEAIGVRQVSEMLGEKRFPKKFMGKLDELVKAMTIASKDAGSTNPNAPSSSQRDTISRYGFSAEDVSKLTKGEASVVISAIRMMYRSEGEFVVPSGKMAGKHVRDLPIFYKRVILQKFPHSGVAKMIREWDERKQA